MTRPVLSPRMGEFRPPPPSLTKLLILSCGAFFLLVAGVLDVAWPQQAVLGLATLLLALLLERGSSSYLVTLTLTLLSVFATFRYGFWRLSSTVHFFAEPGAHGTFLDAVFMGLLLLAEAYASVVLFLGFLQTLWPLRRPPAPLPANVKLWPDVDVLIPTCNEPLSVVRSTVLAAIHIDWPADKLNIVLLDDGNREDFRLFAEEAGIGYIARAENLHAKAGNINHALPQLKSSFVAIFDSDHVPTRSFLQLTVGWFYRDGKLGMIQTPHHFYSPDPFERNLDQFRTIPNEGELFYGVVQDGNDFWNATYFCGSCAVLRRSALNYIGGIAVETVTEDAHTSLRMQRAGWNTAYLNIPQAAGLATERLSDHIRQRIRWARGMVQILRVENPLFVPGLSAAQRLCYFNAMSHFLYALPRLIFLTAPLIYLLFGHINIAGSWTTILAFAIPHLALAKIANSRIQGKHRHSFWNEIYETVLAPYILGPTLAALINPRSTRFNVTAKGGVVDHAFFDARIARPFLILLILDLAGLLMAIPRFFLVDAPWLRGLFDPAHRGTVVVNLLWNLFNMMILGVATAVAFESQQRRHTVRVGVTLPIDIILPDQTILPGITADLSSGGVMIRMGQHPHAGSLTVSPGAPLQIVLPVLGEAVTLPAILVGFEDNQLRAQFSNLTLAQEEALTLLLYGRADTWLTLGQARTADRPLRSILHIAALAFYGMRHAFRRPSTAPVQSRQIQPTLILALLLTLAAPYAGGAAQSIPPPEPAASPHPFSSTLTFRNLETPAPIILRGAQPSHTTLFQVSKTQVVEAALLRLHYRAAPTQQGQLNVSLNGAPVATIPLAAPQQTPGSVTLILPPELVAQRNALTLTLDAPCADPNSSFQLDPSSTIELSGTLLPVRNDLSLLPIPFFDPAAGLPPILPIVFLRHPSPPRLRAAAIVASWFGTLALDRPARFPVSLALIPPGNAILFVEDSTDLPEALRLTPADAPTLTIRPNPVDPSSKLLIVTGPTPDDLVTAARSLALQHDLLAGDTATLHPILNPTPRLPDDAPNWHPTDRAAPIAANGQASSLQGDGSTPLNLYLHLPPDLYLANRQNLALHLDYRYNGIPLAPGSTLQLLLNSAFISSTPLPPVNHASARLQTVVPLPVADLRPFSNTLQAQFAFYLPTCQDTPNLNGAILKDTYLDLTGIPHWTTLPNLELFANAGYPFTRLADLAETTVVLPDLPTASELELFLTLMGHFSAQTGYPVLNVDVTNAEGIRPNSGKDYLVLGTVDDQPALNRLAQALPLQIDPTGLSLRRTTDLRSAARQLWNRLLGVRPIPPFQLEAQATLPDAVLEAIEWPTHSSRSLVVVALRDQNAIPTFLDAFLPAAQSSDIARSVTVLHGARFVAYPIATPIYGVGDLNAWMQLQIFLADSPWILVAATFLVCFIMAFVLRALLSRRAHNRLEGIV